jgi:hypothetical protein
MRLFSVYVAASSREKARAAACMRRLRDAGFVVTYDWTADMPDGHNELALSLTQQRAIAEACIQGVEKADALWLLTGEPSRGAWVELGYSLALPGMWRVSSGPRATAFQAVVDHFDSDDDALAYLLELRR